MLLVAIHEFPLVAIHLINETVEINAFLEVTSWKQEGQHGSEDRSPGYLLIRSRSSGDQPDLINRGGERRAPAPPTP